MAKSDGSVIIDTRIDTAGFGKGVKSMQNQVSGLIRAVGKLGIAIGSALTIKDFLSLGSDLQEVQNVVDVTFTTMSKKVDEFAKKAYKTAGLSETMAKQYVGTFGSMAKAFGFIEEDAYTMSTVLTQLTGDLASFKNLSQEEAFSKLKGVFTGETEALSNIGIVMTQTALDSYALEKGLGKTTKQMSEQEKVALRYQFVLERLEDANGDYVRTLGSWANQTKLLSTSMSQLKATIGEGLINLFTPAIHVLNAIIERLMVAAEAFKVFTQNIMGIKPKTETKEAEKNISNLGDNYTETASGIKDYVDATESAVKSTKKMLSPLDNLNNITSDVSNNFSNTSFSGIGSIITKDEVSNMDDTLNEMEERAQVFVDKIEKFFKPIGEVIKNVLGKVEWKEISENLRDFKEAITPYAENFGEGLLEFFEDFGTVSVEVINDLFGKDGAIIGLTDWLNKNDPEKAEDWGYALGKLVTSLIGLKALGGIIKILTPATTGITNFANALSLLIPIETFFSTRTKDGALEYLESLEKLNTFDFENMELPDWLNSLKEFAMSTMGLSGSKYANNTLVNDLLENMPKKEDYETLEQYNEALKEYEKQARKIFEIPGVEYTDSGWNKFLADLGEDISFEFEMMAEDVGFWWDDILNNIKRKLGLIKDEMGELERYYSNGHVSSSGRIHGGGSVRFPSNYNVPVPHLATGAVLPPNAPFMAMLGDQRNGRNLEAPEGLIRQIMREEIAQISVNATFEVEGDEAGIFRVTQRQAKIFRKQTDKEPF